MIDKKMIANRAISTLKRKVMDDGFKRSVMEGDRFPNMIIGLTQQLQEASKIVDERRGYPLKKETILTTVDEFVEALIFSIRHDGEQSVKSDLAKRTERKEREHIEDMENTIAGNPTGVYEELGVEFVTDREEEEGCE